MEFQIAGGSVPGSEHTKPGKPGWTNNQDAFHWRQTDNCLAAVVCDGCGSGAHSEVGAKISARLVVQFIAEAGERYVGQLLSQPEKEVGIDWERVKTLILSQIAVLASSMGESFSKTINDYFLFTLVGALITPWDVFLFSLGDGVFVLNGEIIQLGPFPNNAPSYLAYNLTGSSLTVDQPELLKIQVNRIILIDELESLILGCDGVLDLIALADKNLPHREEVVGSISQFWTDDHYFTNSDAVRRRLALIGKEGAEVVAGNKARVTNGLLADDTTLVVIRRDPDWKKEVRP
ncbi:MAG: protein phosphatase 2C domain-containing protein [Parcubacteria group bacterium]|nr:protein phosphatase 2C domain-containing protein [Parcubacteria group bacterium]